MDSEMNIGNPAMLKRSYGYMDKKLFLQFRMCHTSFNNSLYSGFMDPKIVFIIHFLFENKI
jgi:hypothetical protein